MAHSKGQNKSPEIIPEEMQATNLLDSCLKYAQRDKGKHRKRTKAIKKTIYEQSEKIS